MKNFIYKLRKLLCEPKRQSKEEFDAEVEEYNRKHRLAVERANKAVLAKWMNDGDMIDCFINERKYLA